MTPCILNTTDPIGPVCSSPEDAHSTCTPTPDVLSYDVPYRCLPPSTSTAPSPPLPPTRPHEASATTTPRHPQGDPPAVTSIDATGPSGPQRPLPHTHHTPRAAWPMINQKMENINFGWIYTYSSWPRGFRFLYESVTKKGHTGVGVPTTHIRSSTTYVDRPPPPPPPGYQVTSSTWSTRSTRSPKLSCRVEIIH